MRAFLFLRYYTFAVLKKILRISKKPIYYKTKYGLKFIPKKNTRPLQTAKSEKIEMINPDELFLGIDGLFDDYTLCSQSILHSPHYDLIICSEKGDIKNCEYIKREEKGYLDSRDYKYVPLKKHTTAYKKAKEKMLHNVSNPILFYEVNGKKYIRDGKHRAALYAFYKKPIPGIRISKEDVKSGYSKKLFEEVNNHSFSKHKEILNWLYESKNTIV